MAKSNNARQRFFDGAMEILAEEGYGALMLKSLCEHLQLSTGSFYFFFPSWSAFTDELIDNWHTERQSRLAEAASSNVDQSARVDQLLQIGLTLQHSAESAIRVWAGVNPRVAQVQELADREALELVTDAVATMIGDPDEAKVLAQVALYLIFGYETVRGIRDDQSLEWGLRHFQQIAESRAREHQLS